MSAQTVIRDAKAFAAAYKPSEDDHPDLQSRVVMFRRAVDSEKGTKRTTAQAVHARTLMQFVRSLGIKEPAQAKKTAAKKTAGGSGS